MLTRWPLLLLLCSCHPRVKLAAIPADATVSLPGDRGPHPSAQTEWWHVHGDFVEPSTGQTLSLFVGFAMQRTSRDWAGPIPVGLVVNPFHVTYVKITVDDRSWVADKANLPDLWDARFRGDGLDLRHGRWRIAWERDTLVLRVSAGRHRLDLRLDPTRPMVLPGEGGRVELTDQTRHLWVHGEAMAAQGRWRDGRRTRWIEGTGFYKHQWGRLYDPGVDGFSWISADLDAQRSVVFVRVAEGLGESPASIAWLTHDGVAEPLGEVHMTPTRWWRSARSLSRWPVAWTLTGTDVQLEVEATPARQEAWVFPTPIYAGPGRLRGQIRGQPVDVPAFIEQVGARKPPLRVFYTSRPAPEAP